MLLNIENELVGDIDLHCRVYQSDSHTGIDPDRYAIVRVVDV